MHLTRSGHESKGRCCFLVLNYDHTVVARASIDVNLELIVVRAWHVMHAYMALHMTARDWLKVGIDIQKGRCADETWDLAAKAQGRELVQHGNASVFIAVFWRKTENAR